MPDGFGDYGLRGEALSPMETLAQSVSTIAPTSAPAAQIIPWLAFVAMLSALVRNLYPVPQGPYGHLPHIYVAYLIAGLLLFFWQSRKEKRSLPR